MRLDGIKFHNIGPFEDFEVDLAALGPAAKLVAFTGTNGAGKSLTLEALGPGAMYRDMPTQGTLISRARARDSFVENRLTNSASYTVRHLLDGISKKSEVVVLDSEGRPVLPDSKVSSYDAWAAKHFPAPSVYLSGPFGHQASGGFLAEKPSARKGILLRALGVERYEVLAEHAREHAREMKSALGTVLARIGEQKERLGLDAGDRDTWVAVGAKETALMVKRDIERAVVESLEKAQGDLLMTRMAERAALEARAARDRRDDIVRQVGAARAEVDGLAAAQTPAEAEAELQKAEQAREAVSIALDAARSGLESARARVVAKGQAEKDAAAAQTRRADFDTQLKVRGAELADAERRILKNQELMAEGETIRRAVARTAVLTRELDQIAHADADLETRKMAAVTEKRGAEARLAAAKMRCDGAQARARRIRTSHLLQQRQEIADAVAALPKQKERHEAAREAARLAAADVQLAKGLQLTTAEERVAALRKPLIEIGAADELVDDAALADAALLLGDLAALARATIVEDDAAVARAAEAPAKLEAAEFWEQEASAVFQLEADALRRFEKLAARAPEVADADREVAEADAEAATANAECLELRDALTVLNLSIEQIRAEPTSAERAVELRTEIAELAETAKLGATLEDAPRRLAELEDRRAAAAAEIARLQTTRDAIELPEIPQAPELGPIELAAKVAEEETMAASAEVRMARFALARAQEVVPRLETARLELDRLKAVLADTPDPGPIPELPDVAGAERRVAECAEASQTAKTEAAIAAKALEDAEAAQARIEALEVERRALDEDLADWTRLADELGRDGLQAAEIDCAGPALTEMVNDLIHSCLGTRFTLSIHTTKLSADGKRELDGCEVRVIDTMKGRDDEASKFSGGEKVLLGEAMSLALTMLSCKQSGLEDVTLVRDESGAALAPENARAWIAMLRRAVDQLGASRCLFVSHTPEVIELADAVIPMPGVAA